MTSLKRFLYDIVRSYRWKWVRRYLDKESKTVIDVGCGDDTFFTSNIRKLGYSCVPVDNNPKKKEILKQSIENLDFEDTSFDVVLCLEVLEHTQDPVKALCELKRVAKKQIIISVPYEPFFTLLRFLTWEKTHLWAITPKILKIYLGKPSFEKKIFFKRYYFAVWNLKQL